MTLWGKRKNGRSYPKGMPGGGKAIIQDAEAIKAQTGLLKSKRTNEIEHEAKELPKRKPN